MIGLPAPLTEIEVDLRGLEYMPLFGDRLFASATWISASPAEKVAALKLWWHAYGHEVPAGSLPDSDALLSEYAGYGVAVAQWRRVKKGAMRGWIQCADGRLYHAFLAEVVASSWAFRHASRARQAAYRVRKAAEKAAAQAGNDAAVIPVPFPLRNGGGDGNVTVTPPVTVTSHGRGRGGEGNLSKEDSASSLRSEAAVPAPADDPVKAVFDIGLRLMTTRGIPEKQARALVGRYRKELGDDGRLIAILLSVEKENPVDPVGYLAKAMQRATDGGVRAFSSPGFA